MTDTLRYRSDLRPERQARCGDWYYKDYSGFESTGTILTGTYSDFDMDALTGSRCWDETHPSYYSRKKLRHYVGGGPFGHWDPIRLDYGGPFWSLHANAPWLRVSGIHHQRREFWPGGPIFDYEGGFTPASMGYFDSPSSPHLGQIWSFNRDNAYGDPSAFGAEAWNKYKPKLEAVNLPLILYELKDLPGQLKETSKGFHDVYRALGGRPGNLMAPTGVASQFLNYQFGWVPFLKDMLDVYNLQHTLKKQMHQNRRDNNKVVRRRGTIYTKNNLVSHYGPTYGPEVYPGLPGGMYRDVWYPANGRYQIGSSYYTLREWDKVSFSGAFKYNIPQLIRDDDAYHSTMSALRALGVRVNPSLIWKAMPWSWLVDWFSNLGDIVDNFQSVVMDDMCATYAYIMRHLTRRITHTAFVHLYDGQDVQCSWNLELDSKRREKANPFGFGLSWGDLSTRQLAILAALGMTRR